MDPDRDMDPCSTVRATVPTKERVSESFNIIYSFAELLVWSKNTFRPRQGENEERGLVE
jgi:hypothetical protein